MTKPQLPDTLSELITVAVQDAQSLDRCKYKPDFGIWHWTPRYGRTNDKCFVCLAGVVIAGTLGIQSDIDFRPAGADRNTCKKLLALEFMRTSRFGEAATAMGIPLSAVQKTAVNRADSVIQHRSFEDWQTFDEHLASLMEARGILQDAGL